MFSVVYIDSHGVEEDPVTFDDVENAAQWVFDEFYRAAKPVLKEFGLTENDDFDIIIPDENHPLYDIADQLDRGEIDHIIEAMGANDPRTDNRGRWEIRE